VWPEVLVNPGRQPAGTAIDVGRVLDEGRWSGYQKLLIAGTALAIILDGTDNQLLGNVIPTLMKEWSLPRAAFATVLAIGPLGMMIGGAAGGMLGDRIGRKSALLCSVIAFAIPTLAIAAADGVMMLGVLRLLAGLGLGGAMPNAAALASEYVPVRRRPFAVTLTIVCIPLGGTLAALLAGRMLPTYGWRALFIAGGVVPIAVAIGLFKLLPESPRYLVARRERWPELIRLLRRLGHDVGADATFVDAAGAGLRAQSRASIRALFAPDFGATRSACLAPSSSACSPTTSDSAGLSRCWPAPASPRSTRAMRWQRSTSEALPARSAARSSSNASGRG
jgi:MFS transporter, AAHS family, 4-hydroxybenzoate transporter